MDEIETEASLSLYVRATEDVSVEPAVQAQAQGTRSTRSRRAAGAQEPNVCGEPTRAGGACKTPRLAGRTRCRFHEAQHDPTLGVLVAADRQRGGAARVLREFGLDLGQIDLTSPADIRRVIAQVAQAVAAGRIPSSVAGSVSQLLNTSIRLAEVELGAKLAALEAQLERLEQERSGRR